MLSERRLQPSCHTSLRFLHCAAVLCCSRSTGTRHLYRCHLPTFLHMAAAALLSHMAWASSISCRQLSATARRGAAMQLHSGTSWAPLPFITPASRSVAARFSASASGPGTVDSPLMSSMQAKVRGTDTSRRHGTDDGVAVCFCNQMPVKARVAYCVCTD